MEKIHAYLNTNWKYPSRIFSVENPYLTENTVHIWLNYLYEYIGYTNVDRGCYSFNQISVEDLEKLWRKSFNETINLRDEQTLFNRINQASIETKIIPHTVYEIAGLSFTYLELLTHLNSTKDFNCHMFAKYANTDKITTRSFKYGTQINSLPIPIETLTYECIEQKDKSYFYQTMCAYIKQIEKPENLQHVLFENFEILYSAYNNNSNNLNKSNILKLACINQDIEFEQKTIDIASTLFDQISDAFTFIKANTVPVPNVEPITFEV